MNNIKSYRDSLLSALCVISWIVIVLRIFMAGGDADLVTKFAGTWVITVSTGIVGGITLHFYSILKRRTLKHSFIYNLFATLNIMAGALGMTLPVNPGQPTPYVVAASLTVGIVMYKNIYAKNKSMTPK